MNGREKMMEENRAEQLLFLWEKISEDAVLCELGLLKTVKPGSVFGAKMVSGSAKVNLESSELIKRLKARRS